MKVILTGFAVAVAGLLACNSNTESKTTDTHEMNEHSMQDSGMNSRSIEGSEAAVNNIDDVTAAYMDIKNALVNDDAKQAASAGKAISAAIQQIDENALSAEGKKIYAEVKTTIVEHGEHIADNAGKITHQREHFEMLSKDMYDMVKVFGAKKTMYYDHCPMFNNNKGGSWLSEEKTIKNPYMGKDMVTCGTVKEEIK